MGSGLGSHVRGQSAAEHGIAAALVVQRGDGVEVEGLGYEAAQVGARLVRGRARGGVGVGVGGWGWGRG